jgi:hypothetical protein
MATTPARTSWVLSAGASVFAAMCVAPTTDVAGAAVPAGDSPLQDVPRGIERVLGPGVEARPDGLYEVPVQGDDALASHGPDSVRALGGAASATGFAPGDAERPPVCATDYYQHVIYARESGAPDRYEESKPEIQAAMRRTNAVLNSDSLASGGGTADYKVLCEPSGEIQVDELVSSSSSVSEIAEALEDSALDEPNADYTIFFDGDVGNACGAASYVDDQRLAPDNLNNAGGGLAVIYRTCWFTEGPMHENAHNQGAVQYGAPNSTGTGGHCYDELDVMCYSPDGGDVNQGGTMSLCSDRVHFDCGADDYFDTAPEPGEYLETHWNLGSPLNNFIALGEPLPAEQSPLVRLRPGRFRHDNGGGTGAWRRYWVRVPRGEPALRIVVRDQACAAYGCDADLDLYVQRAAEPTGESYECRSAGPTPSGQCTIRRPRRGRWYIGVTTAAGGDGAPFKVRATY